MNRDRLSVLALALTLALSGCEPTTTILGAEIQAYIAHVSVDGVIAELVQTAPPVAGSGPTVTAPPSLEVITGGSSQVELAGSSEFETVAIFVDGIDGYYLAPLPVGTTLADMVVTIGSRVPNLQFDFVVAGADATGEWGGFQTISINALEVIGGDIQVSVAWNTTADVDLHVVDPNGEEIYYGHRESSSGGQLDLDANAACSTSEIWQENIGWPVRTAIPGQYIVRVDYWSECDEVETDYVVTVNVRPGVPQTSITPGALLKTFLGTFTGLGSAGGAGSGRFITAFTF